MFQDVPGKLGPSRQCGRFHLCFCLTEEPWCKYAFHMTVCQDHNQRRNIDFLGGLVFVSLEKKIALQDFFCGRETSQLRSPQPRPWYRSPGIHRIQYRGCQFQP